MCSSDLSLGAIAKSGRTSTPLSARNLTFSIHARGLMIRDFHVGAIRGAVRFAALAPRSPPVDVNSFGEICVVRVPDEFLQKA